MQLNYYGAARIIILQIYLPSGKLGSRIKSYLRVAFFQEATHVEYLPPRRGVASQDYFGLR